MKSLSPNAQEFIPYTTTTTNNNGEPPANTSTLANNNQNTMILLVKDPNMNAGYLQYNGINSPIAGIGKPLTISTKQVIQPTQPPHLPQTITPNNNLNQYSIYLNQTNISPNVLTNPTGPPPPGATLMFNGAHGHIIGEFIIVIIIL
jgi:hypothetical protein